MRADAGTLAVPVAALRGPAGRALLGGFQAGAETIGAGPGEVGAAIGPAALERTR